MCEAMSKSGRASGRTAAGVRLLMLTTAVMVVVSVTAAGGSVARAENVYDGATEESSCSGPYVEGSNKSDIWITDDGTGWEVSEILIEGAPRGSRVTCVDVHYEIIHPYVGDLIVDLAGEDVGTEYRVWDNEGGGADSINETETGVTAFNGELVNRVWRLWADDTVPFSDEGYIDSWWLKVYYEGGSAGPVNDGCGDAIELTDGVAFSGSTEGATGSLWSSCSGSDTADVWHRYTPASSGLVTISLSSESFDTTLAVYDSCGGTELVCNDDICVGLISEIMMHVSEGNSHLIRVAGYWGETGDYTITVTSMDCVSPYRPGNPSPADGASDVAVDSPLSWNQHRADKTASALIDPENFVVKGIFGRDDRMDEYEVTDPALAAVGDSTVAVLWRSDLDNNGDGTFSLPAETLAEWYRDYDPILTGNELCNSEPFRNQPNPAIGSGFLVAPDIIATAGHLACDEDCTNSAYVFGMVMLDSDTPVVRIDSSEVYYCSEIIARDMGEPDWALIRLDREVTGHEPLRVRAEGVVPDGERLVVIGHPAGLPRKYAGGATVRENTASGYFQANLDTYHGNSGSAVFNARTLEVEGILYAGVWDFVRDGRCDRSHTCPDTGCPGLEYITRTTEFAGLLGKPRHDVYIGKTEAPSELVCSSLADSTCDPAEQIGAFDPCTTYFWRVVSTGGCGQSDGGIWSFTTGSVAADLNEDCKVDFRDFARLASYWLEIEPSVDIAGLNSMIDFSDISAMADYWLVGPAE